MNEFVVNYRIRARSVRLVDDNGNQLGVMPTRDAMAHASQQGLDLVQITNGEVPVCRITDAGKFMFDKKKAQRENARRQRELQVDIKEIQLRPVTDTNDLQVKARRAGDFLAVGDKVKVTVRFKGRERANKEMGRRVIDAFLSNLVEYKVERPVIDSGRDISMVLAPVKSKSDLKRERQS